MTEAVIQQTSSGNLKYAGFWIRLVAVLLDSVFSILILSVLIMILSLGNFASIHNYGNSPVGGLFKLAFWLCYYPIAESSTKLQGSLGKYLLGIKITDGSGNKISFGRAVGRGISKIFSGVIFCIGYIMVALRQDKRGLHDMICDTYVVYR
jgi:uncharacterized RDD family membrane protein YckC